MHNASDYPLIAKMKLHCAWIVIYEFALYIDSQKFINTVLR